MQKCSSNLLVTGEVDAAAGEVIADRVMRTGLTYARGNQVVLKGVVSWSDGDVAMESPFISFLILDEDGLVIRDRRYLTLDNWPGAVEMHLRLGLSGRTPA